MVAIGKRLQGKTTAKTNNQTQGRGSWAPGQLREGPGGQTGPSPGVGLDDQSGHSGQGNTREFFYGLQVWVPNGKIFYSPL